MTSGISISDLGYRLGDDTEIFTSLTTSIPATVVGLIGDNGVGKSTLAKVTRTALAKALAGDAGPADFEIIGEDWDFEERALGAPADLDLRRDVDALDRRLDTFSGGANRAALLDSLRRGAIPGGIG